MMPSERRRESGQRSGPPRRLAACQAFERNRARTSPGPSSWSYPVGSSIGIRNEEGAAPAHFAPDLDVAAVRFDDAAGDRQAQPGPHPVGLADVPGTSKTWVRSPGAIPLPVSRTANRTPPPWRSTWTFTRPPGGVNFRAFATRLARTCNIRSRSQGTAGTSLRHLGQQLDAPHPGPGPRRPRRSRAPAPRSPRDGAGPRRCRRPGWPRPAGRR